MNLIENLRQVQRDWGLTDAQMGALTHVSPETYRGWLLREAGPAVTSPTIPSGMETAVPLIAIHKRLQKKLKDPEEQVKWLTSPHQDFDGNAPYGVAISSIENLYWLSYYLDSAATSEPSSPTETY